MKYTDLNTINELQTTNTTTPWMDVNVDKFYIDLDKYSEQWSVAPNKWESRFDKSWLDDTATINSSMTRQQRLRSLLGRFINDYYDPTMTMEDFMCKCVRKNYELLEIIQQSEKICLAALDEYWTEEVFEMIKIPIEGELLSGIAKMRLLRGPRKSRHSVSYSTPQPFFYTYNTVLNTSNSTSALPPPINDDTTK